MQTLYGQILAIILQLQAIGDLAKTGMRICNTQQLDLQDLSRQGFIGCLSVGFCQIT